MPLAYKVKIKIIVTQRIRVSQRNVRLLYPYLIFMQFLDGNPINKKKNIWSSWINSERSQFGFAEGQAGASMQLHMLG